MNKEEQQKDLEERVQKLLAFATEQEILLAATQKISPEGYIETVPYFKNLKNYVKDIEVTEPVTSSETKPQV